MILLCGSVFQTLSTVITVINYLAEADVLYFKHLRIVRLVTLCTSSFSAFRLVSIRVRSLIGRCVFRVRPPIEVGISRENVPLIFSLSSVELFPSRLSLYDNECVRV